MTAQDKCSMINKPHPHEMTTAERLDEIASILAKRYHLLTHTFKIQTKTEKVSLDFTNQKHYVTKTIKDRGDEYRIKTTEVKSRI